MMEQVKEHYQDLKIQLETKVRGGEKGHREMWALPAACPKASLAVLMVLNVHVCQWIPCSIVSLLRGGKCIGKGK